MVTQVGGRWTWLGILVAGMLLGPSVAAPLAGPKDTPLPIDEKQEARLLKFAGDGFQTLRTAHFIVAFNTSRQLAADLTGRLEDTYRAVYRFAAVTGIEARRPARRLEVIFFNRREEYDEYGAGLKFLSRGTYGVYHEPSNRSAFFNVYNDPELLKLRAEITASRKSLDELTRTVKSARRNQPMVLSYSDGRKETLTAAQARKRIEQMGRDLKVLDGKRANYSERINRTVIQHEAAHQVLFNAGVHVRGGANPKWIIEGLATMFETPPGEAGTGLAVINQYRLKDFREAVTDGSAKGLVNSAGFAAAIAEHRFESPLRLVGDPRVFNERDERGVRVYAMAWSLANYLQRRQPQKLAAYLREISDRRPGEPVTPDQEIALFEKHFGPLDEAFINQWGKYTLELHYRAVSEF